MWGNLAFAKELKEQIKVYLEGLKLTLSLEKTLITNARKETAIFLGTKIKKVASDRSTILIDGKSRKQKRRVPGGNI